MLKVALTKSYDLYLVNTGDTDLEVRCGELFGFGLGSWTEKLSGHRFYCKLRSFAVSFSTSEHDVRHVCRQE